MNLPSVWSWWCANHDICRHSTNIFQLTVIGCDLLHPDKVNSFPGFLPFIQLSKNRIWKASDYIQIFNDDVLFCFASINVYEVILPLIVGQNTSKS